jgi:hypothetical protein
MTALTRPPSDLAVTRSTWHLLAGHVLAEERWGRARRIGLEPRARGLATPAAESRGVEVDAADLLVRRPDGIDRVALATLEAAERRVLGRVGPPTWATELDVRDPPAAVAPDTPLPVDDAAATWLGGWFQLGWDVLVALGGDEASLEANSPTLWPEHLDVAIEVLPDDRRASYGLSPGDDGVPEPYAYVSVWYPDRLGGPGDARWNADSFPGAVVLASELADAAEPAGAGPTSATGAADAAGATGAADATSAVDAGDVLLRWFRERRDLLAALGSA